MTRRVCTIFARVAEDEVEGGHHVHRVAFCPTKRELITMGLRMIAAAAREPDGDDRFEYGWTDEEVGFEIAIEEESDG